MREAIEAAILAKKLIQFQYGGGTRIAEPHVLGTKAGRVGLLTFQLEGFSSSGGLPQWRRVYLDETQNLVVLERIFAGRRAYPSGRHSDWDATHLIVGE